MPEEKQTVTTVFRVDVTQFKKNLAEANAAMKLANAGFEAATAGMDDWSATSEGLEAKIRQLTANMEAQNKIIATYKEQLEATQEAKRKNIKQADALRESLKKMAEAGEDGTKESKAMAKELAALEKAIAKAEREETDLTTKMLKAEAASKKAARETGDYGDKLDALRADASKAENEIEDVAEATEKAGEQADKAGDGFTIMRGALADLASKAVLKGLDLIVQAGKKIADSFMDAVSAADNLKSSVSDFGAQTGLDVNANPEYKQAIQNVYADNYGEDYSDIADTMATIKQTTGEVDATALEDLTKNALLLRDAFGFDVQDQMRAVDMLMTQFGIDSTTAFNLMAQGAQNGLNKNGDLLDTLNEYSVHYKQLGYSAEEMFNSLANGTEAGTFSVDKLGDAMKEFGIRVKDTSTTTQEGFAALGYTGPVNNTEAIADLAEEIEDLEQKLKYAYMAQDAFTEKTSELTRVKNADQIAEYTEELEVARATLAELQAESANSTNSLGDLQARFAAGGETAREAMAETLQALLDIEDPIKQNEAGVALFGTMWEDLGIEGIKALTQVQGSISTTADALEQINEVKYDSAGAAIEGIKRKLEDSLFVPIGERFLPKVNELADKFHAWLADPENQESLDNLATSVANFASGGLDALLNGAQWFLDNKDIIIAGLAGIAAGFTAFKVVGLIQGIVSALQGMTAAQALATAQQWLLNIAMNANPIGIIIAMIAALVAAFVVLWNNSEDFRNFWINMWEDITEGLGNAADWIWEKLLAIGKFFTEDLPEMLGGAWDAFVEIGSNLLFGIIEGIWNAAGNLIDAALGLGEMLLDALTGFFDINSPSGLLRDKIGKMLPPGIAIGVESNADTAINSLKKLGKRMVGSMDISGVKDKLGVIREGFTGGSIKVIGEGGSGGGNTTTTNNTSKSVTYAPQFHYNKPLNSKEIYRQNKNMLNKIVGTEA